MDKKKAKPERDKVLNGLECCTSGRGIMCCIGCPYAFIPEGAGADYDGCNQLLLDAMELIKGEKDERSRR